MYGRLMRALSRRAGLRLFRFFCRDLRSEPEQAVMPVGIELRQVAEAEALALCGDAELDLRPEPVTAAYARGDLCVAAFDGAGIVGYCWIAFEPLPHLDGVWVAFGSDVAWTYKSLVRPSHRGRGIAPALYRYADARCSERGRALSLICVESHNGASVAAALRAGYVASGHAAYIRRGTTLHTWRSPAVARQGVKFSVPAVRPARA
jgi:GNAT superfamily N-acetyltransferase